MIEKITNYRYYVIRELLMKITENKEQNQCSIAYFENCF